MATGCGKECADDESNKSYEVEAVLARSAALLVSSRLSERYVAVKTIRKLLTSYADPPVDSVVKMGFVRQFVALLDPANTDETLQFEAAWAVGNVAAGNSCHTLAVVAEGALLPLIELLDSPHFEISHQALWALGNIVADNGHFRDLALEAGLLSRLTKFAQPHIPKPMFDTAVWVLVNLCRTKKPCLSADIVMIILPTIFSLLRHRQSSVQCNVIWCLVYLIENSPYCLDLITQSGDIFAAFQDIALGTNSRSVFGLIRLTGNILAGDESYVEQVVTAGCVEKLVLLLDHDASRIQQEVLSCLTNIVVGLPSYIDHLMSFPGLINKLSFFLEEGKLQVQREAVWLFASIAQYGSSDCMSALLDGGVVASLSSVLDSRDLITLRTTLETIRDILKFTLNSGNYSFRAAFDSCGGFEKIEHHQHHDNEIIYQLAYDILDLVSADDELDESLLARDAAAHKFVLPLRTNGENSK